MSIREGVAVVEMMMSCFCFGRLRPKLASVSKMILQVALWKGYDSGSISVKA